MSFDDCGFSELTNGEILRTVKAVDQIEFEESVMSKADKAYKDHITVERDNLNSELTQIKSRIQVLTGAVKQLNDCLIAHISSGKCSLGDFQKIRNSLQNQINAKNLELQKLSRAEQRLSEQVRAQELSAKFSTILDEAGRHRDEGAAPAVVEDGAESDDSGATMVFEPLKEESVAGCLGPEAKRARLEAPREAVRAREGPSSSRKAPRPAQERVVDDADNEAFCERVIAYQNEQLLAAPGSAAPPHDQDLGGGFLVPGRVWGGLYEFQQQGVRWLLQLHAGRSGGILGDEMGLGKTVQVIAFLAGLQRSRGPHFDCGPCLIVCPATVLRQWLLEFRVWAPLFRVAVLHSTGGGYDRPKRLIAAIAREPGVLLTTYTSMVLHHGLLLAHPWQYVILDEGHKIKNPDTKTTLCAKQLQTPHRLIMSGSPIQNNLKELWSLVDFVTPGKLGSLASFMQNFAVPIMKGGYEHATPAQVEAAYRCACVIRDTIDSSLLRRSKSEVRLQLPQKTEQVLFCGLSAAQALVYREYLRSRQCKDILAGKLVPFPGLVVLRKICNHADLVTGGPAHLADHPLLGFARQAGEDRYGHCARSGKMLVAQELLALWFKGGHKVLLFTQGRMMLQILRRHVEDRRYPYCMMDGTTPIGRRHAIVQQFNTAPYQEAFVFLLTTRVGGVGLNLTGADRVLVFDPDWNPCTDLQARERSWRIGQSRQVTIYRLVTSGTVEEKIYHRQVFKQFLTNRILKNPRQRRFFKTQDLHDLFRFDEKGVASDTELMFKGDRNYRQLKKNYFDENPGVVSAAVVEDEEEEAEAAPAVEAVEANDADAEETDEAEEVSEEELARLRRRARRLSKAVGRLGAGGAEEGDAGSVEGARIANVRYRREHKPEGAEAAPEAGGAEHVVVAVLAPRRASTALSYQESRAADLVVDRARRSLDHTLAAAGVSGRLSHEAVVQDAGPDWAHEGARAEAAARAVVAWLRRDPERGVTSVTLGLGLGLVRHARLLAAPSSQALLAVIGARDAHQSPPEASAIGRQLLLYLRQHGAGASSTEIIASFKDTVTPAHNLLFKALLEQLCSFHKARASSSGLWRLRPPFALRQ